MHPKTKSRRRTFSLPRIDLGRPMTPLVPLHHPFPIAIPRGSLTLGWLDAQIATLTGFAEAEGFELVKTFEEIETGNGQTR